MQTPETVDDFLEQLGQLWLTRKKKYPDGVRQHRPHLKPAERERIYKKTGGRCHICGGKLSGRWIADHVQAHCKKRAAHAGKLSSGTRTLQSLSLALPRRGAPMDT